MCSSNLCVLSSATTSEVDRTRSILVKYADDSALRTWVTKEDDIAGRLLMLYMKWAEDNRMKNNLVDP